jgi:hypothetical protein
MANICKKQYFQKTGTFNVYSWCPGTNNYNKTLNGSRQNKTKEATAYSCTATSGSHGFDSKTTYVYNVVMYNGASNNLAYVECDYVS